MKKSRKLLMVLAIVLSLAVATGTTLAYLTDTDSDVNVMTLGNVKIEQHEYERIPTEDGYEKIETDSGEGYKLKEFTQDKPLYPAVGDWTKQDETLVYFDQLDDGANGEAGVAKDLANVQDKFVVVENTGKSDAYVRTLIAFEGTDEATELLGLGITKDWVVNDPKLEVQIGDSTYCVMEFIYGTEDALHPDGILPAGEWTPSSLSQVFLAPIATNEDVEALDVNGDGKYNILVLSQAVQTAGFDDAQTALNEGFGPVNADNADAVVEWFEKVLADSEAPEAPEATEAPDALVNTKEDLLQAIADAEDGDVIAVAPGTYALDESLVIDKEITLQASDPENKPVFNMTTADGTVINSITHGIEIKADNVTLRNLSLGVAEGVVGSGNLVQISSKSKEEYYSDITIDGCEFYGSDHCIALYGNNVTIKNCILDESTAADQGNVIYVWGTSGKLTIQNNQFIGGGERRKHGVSFYYQSAASAISGDILIDGNTFTKMYKSIVHEGEMTYTDVTMTVSNNTVTDCQKKPVAIDNGTFLSYTVTGNVFNKMTTDDPCLIDNKVNTPITANGNYWGSETPDWNTVISGSNVTVENYYTDSAKTNLVTK